ncbi:hypothetical protein ACFL0U_03965 [Pseudomonadota bacterium]
MLEVIEDDMSPFLSGERREALQATLSSDIGVREKVFFVEVFEYMNSLPKIKHGQYEEDFNRLPYFYEKIYRELDKLDMMSELIDKFDLKSNKKQGAISLVSQGLGFIPVLGPAAAAGMSGIRSIVSKKREKKYKKIGEVFDNTREQSGISNPTSFKQAFALLLTLKSSEILQSFTPSEGGTVSKSTKTKIDQLVESVYHSTKSFFSEEPDIKSKMSGKAGVNALNIIIDEILYIDETSKGSIRSKEKEKYTESAIERRKSQGKFVPNIILYQSKYNDDIMGVYHSLCSKQKGGKKLNEVEVTLLKEIEDKIDKFVLKERTGELEERVKETAKELEQMKEEIRRSKAADFNLDQQLVPCLETTLQHLDPGFRVVYKEKDKLGGGEALIVKNETSPSAMDDLIEKFEGVSGKKRKSFVVEDSISIKKEQWKLLLLLIELILSLFNMTIVSKDASFGHKTPPQKIIDRHEKEKTMAEKEDQHTGDTIYQERTLSTEE